MEEVEQFITVQFRGDRLQHHQRDPQPDCLFANMTMKRPAIFVLIALHPLAAADDGWTSLFNGKDLTGWKPNENAATFSVKDGAIVAHGPRSHCFYVGDFHNHTFQDFELTVDVMTLPGSNGGVYIQTEYQDRGWPGRGFEVQVNNTFKGDPRPDREPVRGER
jgi:hypothetical protein